MENLVYQALRRRTPEIYYLVTPGGYEVDFYLLRRHKKARTLTARQLRLCHTVDVHREGV